MAIRPSAIEGYGQLAHRNGGRIITGSPDAPQKWVDADDHVRGNDLERRQFANAQALCAEAAAAGFMLRGCPVETTVDR